MIIGKRLRALRDEKKLHKATLRRRRDCSVVTFLMSNTDTRSPMSKHLRKWLAPWKSLCANCFMRAKSLPSCRIF
jgi:hypothetical protein